MTAPAAEVEVHFAEPHTSSEQALDYLHGAREPPTGHAWKDAKLVAQAIGERGVTFRFYFPAK